MIRVFQLVFFLAFSCALLRAQKKQLIRDTLWVRGVEDEYCLPKYDCKGDSKTYLNGLCWGRNTFNERKFGNNEDDPLTVRMPLYKLSKEFKAETLMLHNLFREKVAAGKYGWPAAKQMKKLRWDVRLSKLAYRWASNYLQTPPNCVKDRNGILNLSFDEGPSPTAIIENWMSISVEDKDGFVDEYKPLDRQFLSHMIIGRASKIGCAHQTHPVTSVQRIACYYSPGVEKGKPVYKKK